MPSSYVITEDIQSWDALQKKMEDAEFLKEPTYRMLEDCCKVLKPKVLDNTPIDLGTLFGDIDYEIWEGEPLPEGAVVGTRIPYAPFVEYDTKPHWPPWGDGSPLAGWAARHGIKAFLVARAISQRGTTGKRMFGKALEDGIGEVHGIMDAFRLDVEKAWRGD